MDKTLPSVEELQKMIQQEKRISGRLTSLRLQRDLSLGGTKAKKVYTPNLNARRNKDKNKHTAIKSENYQKRQLDSAKGVPAFQKNKRTKFMQSEGVFSQGMGDLKQKSNYLERTTGRREHNSVTRVSKNTTNVKKMDNTDLMDELMVDRECYSDSDVEYEPTILPLTSNSDKLTYLFKIKSEDCGIKIKKEEPDKDKLTINTETKEQEEKPFITFLGCHPEDNAMLSILQLPNSFPGKVFKDDPNDKDVSMRHVSEGQVGKILVRKSGKMEMILHNVKYTIGGGKSRDFVEDAVLFPGKQSISATPSVVTLGNVNEKVSLTPRWMQLFDYATQRKKYW